MLILKNVKKKFWDLKAVDNISFQIGDGEIVSLIGSNGAGKTTLVNLISGYLKPDEGTILFNDRDITQASAYNRIKWGVGRSFQIINLFENLSVLDNVRTPLFSKYGVIRRWFLPTSRYRKFTEQALEILRNFRLEEKRDALPKELSEGDRKILDIAVAFALKSRLLLLDEPTSGVATNDKFKVMDNIIAAIKKEGVSTLIIEHDMDIVSGYSDRVLVMHEGRLLTQGKPEEVMEDKEVRAHILGITD
ncbi:MAG: ABC transporter ATP-binding protein [Deltaproteobacteria bacterium]|nr:ABC transporter ATP-binding protein [Deltaproteobacteria bacterium]